MKPADPRARSSRADAPAAAVAGEPLLSLGPALDFMRRLWALNHTLELVSSGMVRTLGITAQQRLIVRCVGKYPGITPSQLAEVLQLDPGTLSAALARLEHRAQLVRRRDHRDRRRVALALTADGRVLDRPAEGTVERAVERLIASSDTAALTLANDVLAALAAELAKEAKTQRAGPSRPPTRRRQGTRLRRTTAREVNDTPRPEPA